MMMNLRAMMECRWAARRIQRYLDRDPAAPLDAAEAHRLEAHLATCARCSGQVEEYRELGQALRQWSAAHEPDPAQVARLHEHAQRLIAQGPE